MTDCILWTKNKWAPCFTDSLRLIVEDTNKTMIPLCLHNTVKNDIKWQEMYKKFPENSKIGIKNPYMVLTYQGTFELRNDNPCNILYVEPGFEDLEEHAVRCLKQKEFF